MRMTPVAVVVYTMSAIGCGDGMTAVAAPVEGPLTLEYVVGSGRFVANPNGEDSYSTYTVRDSLGRAISGAVVRWRLIYDGAPDTVVSDTSNGQGRWTLHWVFSPHHGMTSVHACAVNPADSCEPSQLLDSVTVTADTVTLSARRRRFALP